VPTAGLLNIIGLLMNLAAAVALGLAAQKGTEAGYGGPLIPKSRGWKIAGDAGWWLLGFGYLLQLIAAGMSLSEARG
jgi:hypothetical protein